MCVCFCRKIVYLTNLIMQNEKYITIFFVIVKMMDWNDEWSYVRAQMRGRSLSG